MSLASLFFPNHCLTLLIFYLPFVPGCCDGHGYRSTGVYDNGWFDGVCGTGHPFYLLCQACRESYLQENQASRNMQSDSQDARGMSRGQCSSSDRLGPAFPLTSGQAAPDLLGAAETRHDGKLI